MLLWTFVYRNLCDCVFSPLGHIQGLEFLDRIVSSMFNFEELPKHFSKWMKSTLWDSNIATPCMGIFFPFISFQSVLSAPTAYLGPSFPWCVCVFKQCLLFTWSLTALTSDAVQLALCCSSALLFSPFSALFWILDYLTTFKTPFYLLLAVSLSILFSGGSRTAVYILNFFHPLRIHSAHFT